MLLTIAIPTFNRAEKLELQLKNICEQLIELQRDDICILVQDNHSDDQTTEISNKYMSKFRNIDFIYFRNESNLGFDRNVNLCLTNSKSKYTWILSDDDDLDNNAILTIISEIDRNIGKFNFAFINYIVKSSEGVCTNKCPNIKTKLVNGMDLLYEIELSHSFISSCIFEVKSWLNKDVSEYFDSLWIHLLVARDIVPNGKTLLISEPVIIMNMPSLEDSRDSIIYEDRLEFYTNAHIRISKFCHELDNYGYSNDLKQYLVNKCRDYDQRQVINYKLTVERNSFKDMVRIAKAYYSVQNNVWKYFLFLLPLIFLPREFFKALKWLKYVVK